MRILAPHHDDALLSLPAALLCGAGSVEVVVCFSEESDEMSATCDALHDELAVRVTVLGLTEAVRRGVTLRRCIRPLRELDEVLDEPLLDELAARLRALAEDGRVVLAPLMPVHIDHALTRAAAERAAPSRVGYYEDQPYATLHAALRDRLRAGFHPEWASASSTQAAISSILGRLRRLVGPKQIARVEAAYGAGRLAERVWFPRPRSADCERTVH